MYANYHTHTKYCHHAEGEHEDYIRIAIERGLKVLGFSDHVPCPFSNGHISGVRMGVETTEQYVRELSELREKYKSEIRILIGYEAEYYPKEFENMLGNIGKYGYDYLILGQHYTHNEYDGVPSVRESDEANFRQYVDQTIEAMKTGKFLYLAHPDVINYSEDDVLYKGEMKRLCEAAKSLDIPLEFNILGFRGKRHYPNERFWEVAGEVGNRVIIGSDAHSPKDVGRDDENRAAEDYLTRFNIEPIEALEI